MQCVILFTPILPNAGILPNVIILRVIQLTVIMLSVILWNVLCLKEKKASFPHLISQSTMGGVKLGATTLSIMTLSIILLGLSTQSIMCLIVTPA
jgi:hypothetical protein